MKFPLNSVPTMLKRIQENNKYGISTVADLYNMTDVFIDRFVREGLKLKYHDHWFVRQTLIELRDGDKKKIGNRLRSRLGKFNERMSQSETPKKKTD